MLHVWDHLEPGEEAVRVVFNHMYYITNHARVWSTHARGGTRPRWLALQKHSGIAYHQQVSMRGGEYNGAVSISRIVAQHFLPDYDPSLYVLHIDEELPRHMVNRPENLRMGTQSDNLQDCLNKGRFTKLKVPTDAIVEMVIECGGNRAEAARRLGLSKATTSRHYKRWLESQR